MSRGWEGVAVLGSPGAWVLHGMRIDLWRMDIFSEEA